jgi:hypothetical protein
MQRALVELLVAERDGVTANDALHQWLDPIYKELERLEKLNLLEPGTYERIGWGDNVESTIHRLLRKLRTTGVPKTAKDELQQLVDARPPMKKTPRKTKIYEF